MYITGRNAISLQQINIVSWWSLDLVDVELGGVRA